LDIIKIQSVRTSYSGTRVAPVAHIYYGISPTARFNIHTQDNKNKQLSALLKPLLNPPPIAIAKVHNPNTAILDGYMAFGDMAGADIAVEKADDLVDHECV
jgi:hypothetical protein